MNFENILSFPFGNANSEKKLSALSCNHCFSKKNLANQIDSLKAMSAGLEYPFSPDGVKSFPLWDFLLTMLSARINSGCPERAKFEGGESC
jgi:hypothetical protein